MTRQSRQSRHGHRLDQMLIWTNRGHLTADKLTIFQDAVRLATALKHHLS